MRNEWKRRERKRGIEKDAMRDSEFHWICSFALAYLFLYGAAWRQDTERWHADSLVNFTSMDKATVCLRYCSLYQIRDQVVSLCWYRHNRCRWIESVLSFIFRSHLRRWKNETNYAMKFHVALTDLLYTPDPNNHLDNSVMVDNKYFTGKRKFHNITMIFRKIRQATSQLRLLSRAFEN